MKGKVCLVTGASSGLGLATARELALAGATVVMVGRDRARTQAAADEIKKVGGQDVHVLIADLSSMAEVRRLSEEFKQAHSRLHVLINNAGLNTERREVAADGFEKQFAVNYLAPFLLTNLLLDTLKTSAPSRVITVASEVEGFGKIDFADLMGEKDYSPNRANMQSKLANVLFAYELARRLEGTKVTSTVMNPGGVKTNLRMPAGFLGVMAKLMRPFLFTTPEKGADTIIYLASSPEVEGVSGKYFAKRKESRSSKGSQDLAASRRLWEVSEKLLGVAPPAK
jgi:NAD(P)-dependent dehydrogenase (short-subunit alcohol dehydrogenase family)